MKKIAKIALLVSIMIGFYSCEKEENEKPQKGNFILQGTIVTEKNINSENSVEVIMGDFAEREDDEKIVGRRKIVDKKFAIPLSGYKDWLKDLTIDEIKEESTGRITKIECAKSKIQTGMISAILVKNSGTTIANMDVIVLSNSEMTTCGEDEFMPHGMAYMYCSEDFVFHKDFEKPEELKPNHEPTKFALDLKKGWNLVKVDNICDGDGLSRTVFTSISKIPSDYKWHLVSDLFPKMFNSSEAKKQNQLTSLF